MDLFAGGGGSAWTGKLIGNWRTVVYVEQERYFQEVLKQRIREKIFDDAPIWDEVKTFDGYPWAGLVDIITAGFPCQPFSTAGKRKGSDDDRNLWPETIRIIREVGPRFAFLENVPGLITADGGKFFGGIVGDLAEAGYDCRWTVISASDLGAWHIRKRVWILAYSKLLGREGGGNGTGRNSRWEPDICDSESASVADTECSPAERLQIREGTKESGSPHSSKDDVFNPAIDRDSRTSRRFYSEEQRQEFLETGKSGITGDIPWFWFDPANVYDSEGDGVQGNGGYEKCTREFNAWATGQTIESRGISQPLLGRVAHGVADRVNRVKALGLGWVPIVAATAWNRLTEGLL